VAVKVVLFSQVTPVKAVLAREAVGEVTTTVPVPSITAVKLAPVMVTGVSMSLGAEAGSMALTVGVIGPAWVVQVGARLANVGGWALVAPPRASASRPVRVRERRSFLMARPFEKRCASSPPAAG
jgi:hypothetical protein